MASRYSSRVSRDFIVKCCEGFLWGVKKCEENGRGGDKEQRETEGKEAYHL
jgi:hypothetical protein